MKQNVIICKSYSACTQYEDNRFKIQVVQAHSREYLLFTDYRNNLSLGRGLCHPNIFSYDGSVSSRSFRDLIFLSPLRFLFFLVWVIIFTILLSPMDQIMHPHPPGSDVPILNKTDSKPQRGSCQDFVAAS